MACSVRVFILTGTMQFIGIEELTVLGVYGKYRAAEDAIGEAEAEGWNKTKNRPATENDADTDEVIQYDEYKIEEFSLKGGSQNCT